VAVVIDSGGGSVLEKISEEKRNELEMAVVAEETCYVMFILLTKRK
jgi:hypothetical protein